MRGIREHIRRGADLAWRTARRAWWQLLPHLPRSSHRRDALLYATNELYADYLADVVVAAADDPRIEFRVTTSLEAHREGIGRQLARRVGARYVHPRLASLSWWDAAFFSSPRGTDHFHRDVPKVLVQHGLSGSSGKFAADGNDWVYGDLNVRRNGRLIFAKMFENSDARRRAVVAQQPDLRNVIAVVGNPKIDRMLEISAHHATESMGLTETAAPVLLIQSTFGPHSLIQRWGTEILERAAELAKSGEMRVIISLHPNLWTGYAGAEKWGERARAFETDGLSVLEPGSDWITHMPRASVALTDHTSLSAAFALLGKPVVFCPVPDGAIGKDSHVHQLYELCPRLQRPANLAEVVRAAPHEFPFEEVGRLGQQLLSHRGRALSRFREEILELLGLPT